MSAYAQSVRYHEEEPSTPISTQPVPGWESINMAHTVKAYGSTSKTSEVVPMEITRRDTGPRDVRIKIEWCGICHTDLHHCHGDWLPKNVAGNFPIVPGHEIIGKVIEVGKEVSTHKVGDKVGVGCMVDSCGECKYCKIGEEVPCVNISTKTYNTPDKISGGFTKGGYSEEVVVTEHFVLKVPDSIYGPAAAPLLCAGITSWTPISGANIEPGQKVGVVGLGGLGHMGVKFLKALGANVWVITTSRSKLAGAKELGAEGIVVSTDEEDMAKHADTFDYIYDTVPVVHDLDPYVKLLAFGRNMTVVGAVGELKFSSLPVLFGKKGIKGSPIGNIKQTQEMLDFCAAKNVVSDVETVGFDRVNEAWDRLAKNDVKYRFVLENSTL